jgi:hypothetical protein
LISNRFGVVLNLAADNPLEVSACRIKMSFSSPRLSFAYFLSEPRRLHPSSRYRRLPSLTPVISSRFIIIGIITDITSVPAIITIATIDLAIRDERLHGDRKLCPAVLNSAGNFVDICFSNPGGYKDANVR